MSEPMPRAHTIGDEEIAKRCGYSAALGGPNQVVSASASPVRAGSATQATCPSGRVSTASGALTAPINHNELQSTFSRTFSGIA